MKGKWNKFYGNFFLVVDSDWRITHRINLKIEFQGLAPYDKAHTYQVGLNPIPICNLTCECGWVEINRNTHKQAKAKKMFRKYTAKSWHLPIQTKRILELFQFEFVKQNTHKTSSLWVSDPGTMVFHSPTHESTWLNLLNSWVKFSKPWVNQTRTRLTHGLRKPSHLNPQSLWLGFFSKPTHHFCGLSPLGSRVVT